MDYQEFIIKKSFTEFKQYLILERRFQRICEYDASVRGCTSDPCRELELFLFPELVLLLVSYPYLQMGTMSFQSCFPKFLVLGEGDR